MPSEPARPAGPRPRVVAVIVPTTVFALLLAVLAWSAWPVVSPAREVAVVQAVFDRSGTDRADTDPADNITRPAREVPTVQAPGWLEAEPFFVAATALADGVVESIEVLEGDLVEQGQVIARMVDEDSRLRLRRAQANLADAEAALAIAVAGRDAAQRSWDEPVELERALAASRASLAESQAELAQLPALIDSARATLTRLEEETERVGRSTRQGAANEFELIVARQREAAQRADTAALEARRAIIEARVDRLRAELRAAERNLELRIEDRRRLDAANAGVAAAEAAVARAAAQHDEAALELERMTILAPISGYVQRRLKAPGDKVVRMMDSPHSAHILHLYDPQRLQVRVDVPLADAAHVSVGQRCEVIVEVLPDRTFEGVVLLTTHEADLQKNTLQVKVKVIDPSPVLRPEMLTRVKFLPPRESADAANNGPADSAARVLIPARSLEGDQDAARVWLVTQRKQGRGVLAARPVQVLTRDGEWATVSGPIRPGDLLAVGLTSPSEGERVVIARDATTDKPGQHDPLHDPRHNTKAPTPGPRDTRTEAAS